MIRRESNIQPPREQLAASARLALTFVRCSKAAPAAWNEEQARPTKVE